MNGVACVNSSFVQHDAENVESHNDVKSELVGMWDCCSPVVVIIKIEDFLSPVLLFISASLVGS